MLLRVVNIFQLPTSTILSCETEESIPDRIAGRYNLRDKTAVRQVLQIEGRVSVKQLTEEPVTVIEIFTREAVQLTQAEAITGDYVLELSKAQPAPSQSPA
jgi:hypothetical protein